MLSFCWNWTEVLYYFLSWQWRWEEGALAVFVGKEAEYPEVKWLAQRQTVAEYLSGVPVHLSITPPFCRVTLLLRIFFVLSRGCLRACPVSPFPSWGWRFELPFKLILIRHTYGNFTALFRGCSVLFIQGLFLGGCLWDHLPILPTFLRCSNTLKIITEHSALAVPWKMCPKCTFFLWDVVVG